MDTRSQGSSDNINCSMNLVVFGVAENREANSWHQLVNDAPELIVGHPVVSSDVSYREISAG